VSIFGRLRERKIAAANNVLTLDIGTDLVKAFVFSMSDDRVSGRVLGVGRAKQALGDMQSGAVTDIEGVVYTCEDAIEQAVEMAGGVRPEQVILGIAGELVKGSTTTVRYERTDPQARITLPELKNIIQKVQWKAFDEVRKQLSWETGHSEIDVKLINAAIVDVRIDGYRVTNPLGFQGKHVSIGVFNAYAPLVHLGALQTIAHELDLDLLSIAAEPYAVARCVGGEDASEFSAIFIDVGGGTTDIAVVRNGSIEGTKMFALGGRAFTKRIAGELSIPFEDAEQVKMKYTAGTLESSVMQKVRTAIEGDARVWLSGVRLSLDEFSKSDLLPNRILICGGGSKLTGICSALESTGWHDQLPFTRKPSVRIIRPQDVKNFTDETGQLRSRQDITPLGLSNLALDIAGEEALLSGILRRAVHIMQR
jgi:cell division protein FtsA